MSVQLINLGTPNNNDGDSLYAGGTKINANFTELYTQLAGTSTLGSAALRIDLGTAVVNTPVVGSTLAWSATKNQFVPSSSTMLKTLSHNGSSVLVLTNAIGQAGVSSDSVEYQAASTALDLLFNGRRMWDLLATTTGSTALTRGSWYIGLGNAQATSLAITTRGTAVGGVDGLTVYRNTTEESANSSLTLATGSSGIILYQTPIINYSDYVSPLNSSGAVVHSGFVQEAISSRKFADGTSTMVGVRGVAGGGALALSGGGAVDRQLYTDVRFFKNHLHGLTYSYSNPNINVTSGSAAHYSFSVAGASQVSSADVQAFVVVSSTLTRSFTNSATWQSTNTEASLDTIVANTWYYLYLIVDITTGNADFVATNSVTYSATESKLASASGGSNYRVVRRIGCLRTLQNDITPEPFTTSASGPDLVFNYGFLGLSFGHSSSLATTSFSKTSLAAGEISATGLWTSSFATTASMVQTSAILVRYLPPLPGVTAEFNVIHNQANIVNAVAFGAEPWLSSAAVSAARTHLQIIRDTVASVTSVNNRSLAISPGNDVISDTVLGGTTVFGTSAGVLLRYVVVNQGAGNNPVTTPTFLGWDVRRFTVAR